MAKRVYTLETAQDELRQVSNLTYPTIGEPVRYGDFGNLLKISGVVFQGQGKELVLLLPTADKGSTGWCPECGVVFVNLSLTDWSAIIRRTDDPLVFTEDETGTIKAIHRKVQYAISGAIQQQVWARDGFRCMYCGQPMGKVQLTVDHFVPLELTGGQGMNNYISACRQCNKRKGKQHPADYCDGEGLDYEGLKLYLQGKASAAFIAHLA
jgi:hypothetical protein